MKYIICVLVGVLAVVTSGANVPSTPPPVLCGETPKDAYTCLGSPKFVKPEVTAQCTKNRNECERMKCIFEKSGWLVNNKIDKLKVKDHFDGFAQENPTWAPAVTTAKATCLSVDLPPQGVFLNCPAYDIVQCMVATFFKNAPASQWGTGPECVRAKQYATSCPVCPSDCFAVAIPTGSCNACRLLPTA